MKFLFRIGPMKTFKVLQNRLWIQAYCPEIAFWTRDGVLRFDSALRVRFMSRNDFCVGLCVLGFGFGFHWLYEQQH